MPVELAVGVLRQVVAENLAAKWKNDVVVGSQQ